MRSLPRLSLLISLAFLVLGSSTQASDALDELFTAEEVANSLTLPEVDDQPQPVRQSAPDIPSELRSVNGYARVCFLIDAEGEIMNARIQRSSDPRFDEPALAAVKDWKFRPAKKSGKPVAVRVIVPIRFNGK